MSDLEIRLRGAWMNLYATDTGLRPLWLEAADEIARLRAELSGARQQGEIGQPVLSDAEREAIRSALQSVKMVGTEKCFTTLRGLLERLGGVPEREQPSRNDGEMPSRSGETGDDSPDRE